MNKSQINKYRMASAVDLVLSNHATLLEGAAELAAGHLKLKQILGKIGEFRQVQEADTKGLTVRKSELRKNVNKGIGQLSAALVAHATATGDAELRIKANYTKSELLKAADPILYDIGILLHGLATPIKEELVKYSISEQMLADTADLLDRFKQSIPQRRVANNVSKVSTSNINEAFESLNQLLKEIIDIHMEPFYYTQPDFYGEYKNARKIVNYTGRGDGDNTDQEPQAES